MGVTIEYRFQCDFCEEKVVEEETYHRYEQIRQPYSPNGVDRSWFWLNSEFIACPKHWESLYKTIRDAAKNE